MNEEHINEIVNAEELTIEPKQRVTSKYGFILERPGYSYQVICRNSNGKPLSEFPLIAMTGKGNPVMLTGYHLYIIQDKASVKVRIEPV